MATQATPNSHLITKSSNSSCDDNNTDNNKRNDMNRSRTPIKSRHRSTSSFTGWSSNNPNQDDSLIRHPFRRSSSLCWSAEFTDASSKTAALERSLEQVVDSLPVESFRSPSPIRKALDNPREEETSLASLKSNQKGCGIPWRWSRIRYGIRRRKVIRLTGRRFIGGINQRAASKATCSQGQVFSPEDDLGEKTNLMSQDIITDFSFDSACLVGNSCQRKNKDTSSNNNGRCYSSTNLSHKYQPKLFQEIVGHEIIIKTLSTAVQKEKIAPLYLFYGPSGTGKTSTARIFAMALICESTSPAKPCWGCRGCSRSLCIMELCSGSRISGFERIKTILQSTTFTQAVSGFKVFIIKECHSLSAEAWEELLGIVDRGYRSAVVFVLITKDAKKVPKSISSRCQKFCFPKLKDMDINLKLARIVGGEDIGIEKDALKLIIAKAEGSLREAENILDQLALLESIITSSMVQQLVGLVPHKKLIDLLTTVISADAINTARCTRELIVSGVEPQSLVSQMASLIIEILSGTGAAADADAASSSSSAGSSKNKRLARNGSQLAGNQSERLCHALKILVNTEKQLMSSSDHATWVVAALVQIASENISNRISTDIVLPRDIIIPSEDCKPKSESRNNVLNLVHHNQSKTHHHYMNTFSEQPDINTNDPSSLNRNNNETKSCKDKTVESEPGLAEIIDIEEVWQNMLGRIQSKYVKEFLYCQGRLASLTVSSANVIVHLMFKRPEDKLAAQMSEGTISKALKNAIGCPVTMTMSLEPPTHLGITEKNSFSAAKRHVAHTANSRQQSGTPFIPEFESSGSPNARVEIHQNTSQKSSNLRHMELHESIQMSQGQNISPSGVQEAGIEWMPPQRARSSEPYQSTIDLNPLDITYAMRDNKHKHRNLSLSSIQQVDASVEPYSQDLLFENAHTEKEREVRRNSKHHKGYSKGEEHDHCQQAKCTGLSRSWSCTNIFCQGKRKVSNHTA